MSAKGCRVWKTLLAASNSLMQHCISLKGGLVILFTLIRSPSLEKIIKEPKLLADNHINRFECQMLCSKLSAAFPACFCGPQHLCCSRGKGLYACSPGNSCLSLWLACSPIYCCLSPFLQGLFWLCVGREVTKMGLSWSYPIGLHFVVQMEPAIENLHPRFLHRGCPIHLRDGDGIMLAS